MSFSPQPISGPMVCLLAALAVSMSVASADAAPPELRVTPETVVLDGPESTHQLLVRGRTADLTHQVRYEVTDPNVASVSGRGLLEPRSEGTTDVRIRHAGQSATVRVEVRGMKRPAPVSFEQQVMPLLTKAGCNSGGCHGKAEGQNGFKLSVFGFDPESDYAAIVYEARGRRVFLASPESSLLVGKATGRAPHGGGKKITEGTLAYKRLVRWIAEGTPLRTESIPPVASIGVEPSAQSLVLGGSQQLRVTAVDTRGQRRDVTAEAEFESNATTIAGVDRGGFVQAARIPGEAAILVRYLGQVTVCRVTVPRTGVNFLRPPETNFVDKHVWDKLERLGIPPSEPADDATFLRRVFLDVIGTLPTAHEARVFLADTDPKKRAKLIDALLERPEYADYMALKWADLLRVDRDVLTANGAVAFTRWLRQQFADNRSYDQFVRDILTAEGKVTATGPAGLYKALEKPEVMSRSLSQVFLGVRIECAQCHHHPSDRWGQDDYYALAGFFTGVSKKGTAGGEAVVSTTGADLKHPRTGSPVPTRVLGGKDATFPDRTDRRVVLADWMTSPENPYFARSIVNRLWAHYLGRGLIEPIDDLRSTNPAANEPLLAALARHLTDSKYDLKALIRTILNSRVYQLGPAMKANADDAQNFSHARTRTLPAEVLLDAICQTTGVPEKFNGTPEGVRAIQLWDNRMPSYFLKLFGRPARTSVCECERSTEPSIAQALHLMNAQEIEEKIRSRRGTARKLVDSEMTPAAIVEELYLATHSRFPTQLEKEALLKLFDGKEALTRREAVEDTLWTLLNTKDVLYNR
jgi:Protein of unknown function (DUF1549)/Protein of unknown function (DUF1553)/Bacterial Ig-like domain (group 2)